MCISVHASDLKVNRDSLTLESPAEGALLRNLCPHCDLVLDVLDRPEVHEEDTVIDLKEDVEECARRKVCVG